MFLKYGLVLTDMQDSGTSKFKPPHTQAEVNLGFGCGSCTKDGSMPLDPLRTSPLVKVQAFVSNGSSLADNVTLRAFDYIGSRPWSVLKHRDLLVGFCDRSSLVSTPDYYLQRQPAYQSQPSQTGLSARRLQRRNR
jgi:hypothetical protein